jgi:hypothetical protein
MGACRQMEGGAGEVVDMLVLDARNGTANGVIVGMKGTLDETGRASMRCTAAEGCAMV